MRCGHRPSGTVPRPETRDASALIRRRSAVSAWLGVASGVSFRQGLRHASLWGVTARRKGFRVRLGMDREIAVRTGGGVWKRTELRRASDGGADSAAISPVPPCASGTGRPDGFAESEPIRNLVVYVYDLFRFFERGARVLSFPINPPKDERSRPFRRMDRAFRK